MSKRTRDAVHVRSALVLLPSQGLGGGIEALADMVLDALHTLGVEVELLAMLSADRPLPSRWVKVRFSVLALWHAWVRRKDLDHVVVTHPSLSVIAVLIHFMRGAERPRPTIIFHDVADIGRTPRWLLALIRRLAMPIVTVSAFSAGALAAAGAGRARVLTPALNAERYATFAGVQRMRTEEDLQAPEVLTVCRLDQSDSKGVPVLAEAVDRLRSTHPAITLVVAGRGPAPRELVALADARSWFRIVESPSALELAECYRAASVFVLATRTQSSDRTFATGEGFGLVLAEAQLAGLPVVAPASGGSADAIVAGITGVRPADESPAALVEALMCLLDEPIAYARMSESAGTWAAHAFSPERAVRAVEAALLGGVATLVHGIRLTDESSRRRGGTFLDSPRGVDPSLTTRVPAPKIDPERQTISAVVLTLNEEVNIARCVESLTWADEVVIVDSVSNDRTVEIARHLGARVVEHRQVGVYSNADQRNWALEHADLNTDWILFVDADEVVPDVLAARVRECCDDPDGPDAYQLVPKYLFWGRWMRRSMRYPAWHDRLVRRGRVTFEGGVWEHLRSGVEVGQIAEPYLHYGNSKGFEDWLERHSRYSSWDARSVLKYLESGDPGTFDTTRQLRSREAAARLWRIRPLLRFVLMYIIRGGFLDGPEAFVFCLRYAVYDYMTVEKIIEARRRRASMPL